MNGASLHGLHGPPPKLSTSRRESPPKIRNCKASSSSVDNVNAIFTYGILKRGFYNHVIMEELMRTHDAVFMGNYSTVKSFPLVIGPHRIPYLINLHGSGQRVRGELYSVSSDRGLALLDKLEGFDLGHYARLPLEVVSDNDGTHGRDRAVVVVEAYFAH